MGKVLSVRKMKTLATFLLVFFAAPLSALAQTREFDENKGEVASGTATIKGLEAIFENVISVALAIAGLVLFVMLVVGGFRYLTSGGDPKAAESARGTITHAILGLVVVILAFLILSFISTFTGVTEILNFQIIGTGKN